MNFIHRIKNLWELSRYEPGQPTDEYKIPGTEIVTLVKKPEPMNQKATFIPRNPIKPIDRINNIGNET
jgi:hypothetical protein